MTAPSSFTSIRQKITTVIMLITGVVLVIACSALFAFQAWTIKNRMINELAVTADMVAGNIAVAAMFKDEERSQQILNGLQAMPQISAAWLELNDGTRLAQFGNPNAENGSVIPKKGEDLTLVGHRALFVRTVRRDDTQQGTLYLLADFEASYFALLKLYGAILLLVIAVSLLLTYLLTGGLQHLITAPILTLTATANQIASGKDYSVRAKKAGNDEVGVLTDTFNLMLEQIQAQDSALQSAQAELRDQIQSLAREIEERKAAQFAQERLIEINEATPDFVGRADLTGRTFYINPAGRKMFGLAPDLDVNTLKISDYHPDWVNKLIKEEALPTARLKGSWSGETALLHRNGGEVHVSQVIIAHKNAAGEVESFSTVMRDMSERRAAEDALRESQEQLLKSSRLAGMAEVATSVLHNVGNVLNSVNVSGNIISERIRSSKIETLHRTAKLILDHQKDLANFITNDPRGQRISEMLTAISNVLREEHNELVNEIDIINSNIGHIKEIVAMQQNYSRVSGVSEIIEVAQLVESAIKMNAISLARHRIEVIQNFSAAPKVQLDRHKVLQILVNLLANAKQAVDESGRTDKQITVKIQRNSDQFISIMVQDNGIGIESSNLARIFSHGFTTKKTGHGYGLHSGALAATEVGGSLKVQSDGLGTGATFTLELPISLHSAA
jgi:PAS domain S-box-containing protein